MTDRPTADNGSKSGEEAASGPLAGQRLAAARRKQDISAAEIAKELHLDEAKIRALESNEFEVIGAPVFVKGHLRKYAELVGIPAGDVLGDYYELTRGSAVPPVVAAPHRRPSADLNLGPWLAGGLVVVLAGAASWWWLGRPVATPAPAERPAARVTVPAPTAAPEARPGAAEEPAPESATASAPAAAARAEAEDTEPPGDDTADVEPAGAPDTRASVATGPTVSLTMMFTGDCWTEVTDADGQRLFFDLGREGRRATVSGTPPLRVLFGSADNVELEVDGRDYAIPLSARRGDTARLTITRP